MAAGTKEILLSEFKRLRAIEKAAKTFIKANSQVESRDSLIELTDALAVSKNVRSASAAL